VTQFSKCSDCTTLTHHIQKERKSEQIAGALEVRHIKQRSTFLPTGCMGRSGQVEPPPALSSKKLPTLMTSHLTRSWQANHSQRLCFSITWPVSNLCPPPSLTPNPQAPSLTILLKLHLSSIISLSPYATVHIHKPALFSVNVMCRDAWGWVWQSYVDCS
jgi:hypothetical protein